jgi:hypothetical protein
MNLNKFSKENVTIAFYVIYAALSYGAYLLFPGDAKTPNFGKLLMFLLIPISFIYAAAHVIKHFNSDKSYFNCGLVFNYYFFD